MWKVDVLGTRAFRLALAFALAVTAATVGAFALIYLLVADENAARIGDILSEEVRLNLDASADRLRLALQAREAPDIRRIDYVALFDRAGARVVGNLQRPIDVAADGRPHKVNAEAMTALGAVPEPAILVCRHRSDGGLLVLGRTLREAQDIERTLFRTLGVVLIPTVAAILAIGLMFASQTLRRLDGMRETMSRVMEGRLDLRLSVTGERDEIDQVARAVNLMLNEIARLLDQLRSVGENIAHDLRTPLAAARMKLERALELPPDAAQAQLQGALGQLDRASAAIGALMRMSAVDQAAQRERFRELDLTALCAQTAEFFEPLAQSRSLALTCDAASQVSIYGDEDLLREAIANLIENAIKFTPSGGGVRVGVASGPHGPRVEVTDTGPGVPAAERENIFRRFYCAPALNGEPGHGLGLSIVRTVADLHRMEVGVEDAAPGARFTLSATSKYAQAHARKYAQAQARKYAQAQSRD